jgi:transketolase
MRRAFAETLAELAQEDPRIVLLTGDLGFMALESFRSAFPKRFFNVGVAEQNMIGVATGLAEAGFIPFAYSIVTFAVLRPFEFIRNGPIAQQLPVRIVSVGAGFEYGHNGLSHYGLEDVALMRSQPGISIVCPCDAAQTRSALRATHVLAGPVYFRLGKDDAISVDGVNGRFELGRADVLHEGNDLAFIALGSIAGEAIAAARALDEYGVSCAVIAVSSITPKLCDNLARLISQFPFVVTVEAHYVTGGLGSLVSEIVAEQGLHCRVTRAGIKTLPDGRSGTKAFLQHEYGISSAALAQAALAHLATAPAS